MAFSAGIREIYEIVMCCKGFSYIYLKMLLKIGVMQGIVNLCMKGRYFKIRYIIVANVRYF